MEVESLRQLKDWVPPQRESVIGDGILLPKTRMVIYGFWKSWKSMFAMHTAFSLAAGSRWIGHDTRPSTIHLLQLEIPKAAFRTRVVKYSDGHNVHPTNMWFSTQHYLKLDRDFGFKALDKTLEWTHPDVLIVDPLYKVLSGNISDSYDMMKLLDNMDQLIERHNLSVIMVTHRRKSKEGEQPGETIDRGAEEMMGSSYLANWCDSAVGIRVTHGNPEQILVSFDAMRNAEDEIKPVLLRINRQTLGFKAIAGPDMVKDFAPTLRPQY